LSIAKALRIGQNVRDIIGAHSNENLEAVTRAEKHFVTPLRIPGARPLGITVKTFNPSGRADTAGTSPKRRRH
jgi:hypothetical protein